MLREDIRGRVRDYLYEQAAESAKLWTDTQINSWITEELLALPRKGIYLEEIWTTTLVQNQLDYTIPTGAYKVEKLEVNVGTTTVPSWVPLNGWDNYGGAIYLNSLPSYPYPLRAFLRKQFTAVTADGVAMDIPDAESEALVAGVCLRAFRALMGFFMDAKGWDTVAKPDGISLNMAQNWYMQAKKDYLEVIQTFKKYPRPREINLTG